MPADISLEQLRRVENAIQKFGAGSDEARSALKGLSTELTGATSSLNLLRRSTGAFVGGMAKGDASLGSFAGIVSSSSKTLSEFAARVPAIGVAIGKVIEIAGAGAAFMIEQYDLALGTFQDMSKIGAIGIDGIDTMRQNMVEAGVPLAQFAKMIALNNEALVGLTGSADNSAKQFSAMMHTMRTGLDQELRMLGFSADEIGETLSNFANLQRRLGNLQHLDQQMLTTGAVAFGKELDAIAKLTGQSRTEQQKTLESAMREGRYLASQRQLQRRGDQGTKAAKEVQNLMLATAKISPALSAAIKDISGGFISTQAAQQGFVSTGGVLSEVMQQLKSGNIDSATAMQMLQDSLKQTMPVMESINLAVGDSSGAFIPLHEAVNTTTFAMGNFKKAIEENKKTQDAQINADPSTTTTELVNAQKYLLSAATHLQATAISFDSVSGGLEIMMKAIDDGSKVIYRRIGTIGDIQRPNSLQTQSDITIRDASALHSAKSSELVALNKAVDMMSPSPMHNKQRKELTDRIKKLTDEIATLDQTMKSAYAKKVTETPTLGRLFKHILPAEHWADPVNPFVTSPGALKERLETESGMSSDRQLSEEELDKFREAWNKGSGVLNDDIWQQFKQIFEEMNKNNNSASEQNVQSLNEMSERLDTIVTALNQGNKNTQGIKQQVQMS